MSAFEFAEELSQPPYRFSNTGAMTAGRRASFRARRRRIHLSSAGHVHWFCQAFLPAQ